jgi:hypothetical protein
MIYDILCALRLLLYTRYCARNNQESGRTVITASAANMVTTILSSSHHAQKPSYRAGQAKQALPRLLPNAAKPQPKT